MAILAGGIVACPFFMPTERFEGIARPHRARLPLGDGWKGQCTAPGHQGTMPDDGDLAECCNLGYATACPRLPADRECDAVRFSIARDRDELLLVFYIFERAHRPGEHGTLEFDAGLNTWRARHHDPRIQKMAECYLESYLQRRDARALQPTS